MFSTMKRDQNISPEPLDQTEGRKSLAAKFFNLITLDKNSAELEPETALEINSTEAKKERKTPVIGILGVKGGVGATTTAINLASILCRHYSRAVLIDSNMQQPDVALTLSINPKFCLCDLIERRGRLDERVLEACCESISLEENVLKVVSPPLELTRSLSFDVEPLTDCLEKVKDYSDMIVIDLQKVLDKNLLALLDSCDKIILVSEPTITSISGAKRWLSIFNDLEYSLSDVSILFNERDKKQRQIEEEALRALKIKTHWTMPNAAQQLENASLEGVPAVLKHPNSQYAKALDSVVSDIRNWFDQEAF